MRLIQDGRFGSILPKLHLAQNLPCAPLISMWSGNTATKNTVHENCPKDMYDDVLFNRKPPFSTNGGVRDALQATGGRMYGIDNAAAAHAQQLFEKLEGIDINPASAVAVAALIEAAENGNVNHNDSIVLNITGGGMERLRRDHHLNYIMPDIRVSAHDPEAELKIVEKVAEKFKR
jgi:cysteate synthase